MVPNKRFFVYLQKKLGAKKYLFIYKRNWGQINDFEWGGGRRGGEKYKNPTFSIAIFVVIGGGEINNFCLTFLAFINTKYLAFTNT